MFSTYIEDYLHRRQRLPYPSDLQQDLNINDPVLNTNDYWKWLFSKACVSNLKDMGFSTSYLYRVYEDLLMNAQLPNRPKLNTTEHNNDPKDQGRVGDSNKNGSPTKEEIAIELKKIGLQTFFLNAPTERQLATLNALTDIADQRSIARKLHDLDVSTAELQAWFADEVFVRNFVERSHAAVELSKVQSILSLAMRASNGDHHSISLLDGLTSRFRQENAELRQETLKAIKYKVLELIGPLIEEEPSLADRITDKSIASALISTTEPGSVSNQSKDVHPPPDY